MRRCFSDAAAPTRILALYYRVLFRHVRILEVSVANPNNAATLQIVHGWLEFRFIRENSEVGSLTTAYTTQSTIYLCRTTSARSSG